MAPLLAAFPRAWLIPILLALVSSANACSLPVFRYALDRWHPDAFTLHVSAEDAKEPGVAKFLRNFSAASALNLNIERITEGPSTLLAPDTKESLSRPIWSGVATVAFLESLSKSSVSREIVTRILKGDSVVWVVVESGNADVDAPFVAALQKRLDYLQQVVRIPEADPTDLSSKPGPGPALELKYSVLRVPHQSPDNQGSPQGEALLVKMLAGAKSGLADSNGPWVAAVFGRGRVLGAWPAVGFGDEQIEEIALFLAGACSCQVKRQNPGWDLLLHVDWDEALHAVAQTPVSAQREALQATPKTAEPLPSPAPETVRIEPPRADEMQLLSPRGTPPLTFLFSTIIGGILLLVLFFKGGRRT